jgi:hypothetical protein
MFFDALIDPWYCVVFGSYGASVLDSVLMTQNVHILPNCAVQGAGVHINCQTFQLGVELW